MEAKENVVESGKPAPCPFCGNPGHGHYVHYTMGAKGSNGAASLSAAVVCSRCGAKGPNVAVSDFTHVDAIWTAWNTRPLVEPATELIAGGVQ